MTGESVESDALNFEKPSRLGSFAERGVRSTAIFLASTLVARPNDGLQLPLAHEAAGHHYYIPILSWDGYITRRLHY